eukprot:Skav232536  [mRNA]  locus=scaffold319:127807:129237:+ [translate_table: standard]
MRDVGLLGVLEAATHQGLGRSFGVAMVDYSKWDKLDISDDEQPKPRPHVSKFDAPQTVTIGAQAPGNSQGAGNPSDLRT